MLHEPSQSYDLWCCSKFIRPLLQLFNQSCRQISATERRPSHRDNTVFCALVESSVGKSLKRFYRNFKLMSSNWDTFTEHFNLAFREITHTKAAHFSTAVQ